MRKDDGDLSGTIGSILRYGVLLSAAVISTGLALVLLAPSPATPGTLQAMLSSGFGTPTLQPSALVASISTGSPLGFLELGTLILLATPISRVTASVVLFARERDTLYACITVLVLGTLLLAIFFIGPLEG